MCWYAVGCIFGTAVGIVAVGAGIYFTYKYFEGKHKHAHAGSSSEIRGYIETVDDVKEKANYAAPEIKKPPKPATKSTVNQLNQASTNNNNSTHADEEKALLRKKEEDQQRKLVELENEKNEAERRRIAEVEALEQRNQQLADDKRNLEQDKQTLEQEKENLEVENQNLLNQIHHQVAPRVARWMNGDNASVSSVSQLSTETGLSFDSVNSRVPQVPLRRRIRTLKWADMSDQDRSLLRCPGCENGVETITTECNHAYMCNMCAEDAFALHPYCPRCSAKFSAYENV